MPPAHGFEFSLEGKDSRIFDLFAYVVPGRFMFARFGGFSYSVFSFGIVIFYFLYYDYKRFFKLVTRFPGRVET